MANLFLQFGIKTRFDSGAILQLWTLYIHSPFLFGVKVLVIDVMHYLV